MLCLYVCRSTASKTGTGPGEAHTKSGFAVKELQIPHPEAQIQKTIVDKKLQ